MKIKRAVFTGAFLLLQSMLFAQFQYEPSVASPYGRLNPDAPKEVKDFAPLIGKCNCLSESRNPDRSWAEPVNMIWTYKYIMNGMAVQDETLKADGAHSGSIRQYNADSARWYVHYYSSSQVSPRLSTWEGNLEEDGRIVLYREQKAPNGAEGFFRLTFYEIDQEGYKWIGEWVNQEETISYATWKIVCKKNT